MTVTYQLIGTLVFWPTAVLLAVITASVGASLWRDRAHIRWPWQRKGESCLND